MFRVSEHRDSETIILVGFFFTSCQVKSFESFFFFFLIIITRKTTNTRMARENVLNKITIFVKKKKPTIVSVKKKIQSHVGGCLTTNRRRGIIIITIAIVSSEFLKTLVRARARVCVPFPQNLQQPSKRACVYRSIKLYTAGIMFLVPLRILRVSRFRRAIHSSRV